MSRKIIIFCTIISLLSCSRHQTEQVRFSSLQPSIQDTLHAINNQQDTTVSIEPPELIDFTGRFIVIIKEFGPWIISKQIKDTINNKTYTIPSNAPTPYIITNKEILYPLEYNRSVMGFTNQTLFQRIAIN
ncbi:hypothetical protein [Prevotella sp.]|uniref:hypothetical protein n=1 Tax=Prevotella sp. TaxID=59823 RepID=UPI002F942AF9